MGQVRKRGGVWWERTERRRGEGGSARTSTRRPIRTTPGSCPHSIIEYRLIERPRPSGERGGCPVADAGLELVSAAQSPWSGPDHHLTRPSGPV